MIQLKCGKQRVQKSKTQRKTSWEDFQKDSSSVKNKEFENQKLKEKLQGKTLDRIENEDQTNS